MLTDLQNRGVQDLFVACVDGLTGFPEAIAATYPQALVQLCMVHLVRNSVAFVSYKDRKAVCADLKAIYSAATEAAAQTNLDLFTPASYCQMWCTGENQAAFWFRVGSSLWSARMPSWNGTPSITSANRSNPRILSQRF